MIQEEKIPKEAAWSKEDKEMLNSAVKFVEHSPFSTIGKDKNNVLAWLKSLSERFNPQPKQGKKGLILTEEQENKFGHLFTRPSWKPSEEQMEALETAKRWYSDNMGCNPILESLYEQLKKL